MFFYKRKMAIEQFGDPVVLHLIFLHSIFLQNNEASFSLVLVSFLSKIRVGRSRGFDLVG